MGGLWFLPLVVAPAGAGAHQMPGICSMAAISIIFCSTWAVLIVMIYYMLQPNSSHFATILFVVFGIFFLCEPVWMYRQNDLRRRYGNQFQNNDHVTADGYGPDTYSLFRQMNDPTAPPNVVILRTFQFTNPWQDVERQMQSTDSLPVDQTTCSICLADYCENDTLVELPCYHCYHQGCIAEWLKLSQECPVCKHVVTDSTNYHHTLRPNGGETNDNIQESLQHNGDGSLAPPEGKQHS